jgi:hypothetical protein
MRHSIAKVKIKVAAGAGVDGIRLQHALSKLFWQELSAKIEGLFDQLSKEGETLVIEHLFIDLGHLNETDWASDFQVKLLEALGKALQIAASTARKNVADATKTQLERADKNDDAEEKSLQITGESLLPDRQRLFDIWLYFLKTGTLPPAATLPADERDWQRAVLETLAAERLAEKQFLEAIIRHSEVAARLSQQFDELFLARIAAILNRKKLEQLPSGREQLFTFWASMAPAANRLPTVKKLLLQLHFIYSKSTFWAGYFRQVATENLKNIPLEKAVLLPVTHFWQSLAMASKQETFAFMQEYLVQKAPGNKKKGRPSSTALPVVLLEAMMATLTANARTSSQMDPSGQTDSVLPIFDKPKEVENDTVVPHDLTKEGIYVQQAGIVLVHAFLPTFFKTLGLLNDEKQFLAPHAQQRAIHLIQFLATGEERLPEYRLILPKFLCGLPLEIPLERDVLLTDLEKSEADTLLKAIIGHWEALGATSPAGLREGFIDRVGKLTRNQKGPCLQVESRTQDILFSRLPWSIGLIKLPWMKEMLQVEWNY